MNRRQLKKYSKRALPLLRALGDVRKDYRITKADPAAADRWILDEDKRTRRGRTRAKKGICQANYAAGTVMVGCTSGYYEPEWLEEDAYSALWDHVAWANTVWDEDGAQVRRRLRTVAAVFREAELILAGAIENDDDWL